MIESGARITKTHYIIVVVVTIHSMIWRVISTVIVVIGVVISTTACRFIQRDSFEFTEHIYLILGR